MKARSGIFLFLALAITGCGAAEHKDPAATPVAQKLTSFTALSTEVLQPKCVSCHGGKEISGGVDLTSYAAILAKKGVVTLGNPAASLLYTEVQDGSMPDEGPHLSANEIQAIGEWIQSGAPDGDFIGTPDLPPDTPPAITTGTVYADIQTRIFNQACVKCHSGTKPKGKIDLTSYAALHASTKTNLIVPGAADKSLIFSEISTGQMPPKGPPISINDQNLLRDWINAGAPQN
ncbi:MAG: c-type cytochrome domain-containing protein [Bdellovibrionales bacterium]